MYNYSYYPDYNTLSRNSRVNSQVYPEAQDERFFWAPFVVGGLAGTALGYGIANNNQINPKGGCCMQPVYYYPVGQQIPAPYSYNNNFYY